MDVLEGRVVGRVETGREKAAEGEAGELRRLFGLPWQLEVEDS